MRCPGFAALRYNAADRTVTLLRKSIVANRKKPAGQPAKTHGQILNEIIAEFNEYILKLTPSVFVRERAFARFNNETKIINKVVGVTDLVLWQYFRKDFIELTPLSVKKTVSNDSSASKDKVADRLSNFIGPQNYQTDDESDAAAVGVAWLVQNGYLDSPYPQEDAAK